MERYGMCFEFVINFFLTVTDFVQERRQEGIQGLVFNSKEDILRVRESLQVFPAKYQEKFESQCRKHEKFHNIEEGKKRSNLLDAYVFGFFVTPMATICTPIFLRASAATKGRFPDPEFQ